MFELTDAIVLELAFAMENKNVGHVVDLESGSVMPLDDSADAAPEDCRSVPVPEWTSRSGFRLMERFAATIADPLVREALRSVLDRGHGVFRAFKAAAEEHGLAERWRQFKTAALKQAISAWYDDLREAAGLERLGAEPEDVADLVLSDYVFKRTMGPAQARSAALLDACHRDASARFPAAVVDAVFSRLSADFGRAHTRFLTAENAAGESEGLAVIIGESAVAWLVAVYVEPDRRGIGLGRALVESAMSWCQEDGITAVLVDLPFAADWFSARLAAAGYRPIGARLLANAV